MELTDRHLELIVRTAEKVEHIDEKLDGLVESQRDQEHRIRELERRNFFGEIQELQEIGDDHEVRIADLELSERTRNTLRNWKELTVKRLIGIVGAAGTLGAFLMWVFGGSK